MNGSYNLIFFFFAVIVAAATTTRGNVFVVAASSTSSSIAAFSTASSSSLSSSSLKTVVHRQQQQQQQQKQQQLLLLHPITSSKGRRRLIQYRYSINKPESILTTHRNDDEDGGGGDTSEEEEEEKMKMKMKTKNKWERVILIPIREAKNKFRSRPLTYAAIPCIAAFVGWFTNWLAVQMIFYPIQYRGINWIRWEDKQIPLGLFGWQGIIPCKSKKMSEAIVHMVTTQLINVKEIFQRLDPQQIANLLAPQVPQLGQDVLDSTFSPIIASIPSSLFGGLSLQDRSIITHWNKRFLRSFTKSMQQNIDSVLNLRNCVVNQMMEDRAKLGQLFQIVGHKELQFLTNSGLWFGFLLGIIQMIVALFYDNPWTLSIGGAIVGLATNWLALKWIFEPINPTKFGPFILQGQFLRRQKEVAKEFSSYFADNILTSEKIWHSILNDPQTVPAFHKLFVDHLLKFISTITSALHIVSPEPSSMRFIATKGLSYLPNHVHVLHSYVDETLQLKDTLRLAMEGMSSVQFERVLHPIFEEDELTLILAGAFLGFGAGLIQQCLESMKKGGDGDGGGGGSGGGVVIRIPKRIQTFFMKLRSFFVSSFFLLLRFQKR